MKNGKILFIFNPHSGKAQIKSELMDIIDVFVKNEYEVTVFPTQKQSYAYGLIKEKGAEYEIVAVSGGDGTLNEAINGLMSIPESKRPILGYIPSGTTNDFASSLNISKKMKKAAEDIAKGGIFECDIGKFKSSYFSYVAAFGAFTDVPYETPQQNKNALGHMAYILEGIKKLPQITSYKLKVEADGIEIEDEFLFGMVSNSNFVAGIKRTGEPDISLNDGLFEVFLVKKPDNPISMQFIIADVIAQNLDSKYFYTFKTDKLKFTSKENIDWTLDGEFGGSVKTAKIENIKKAVKIRVAEI